MKIFLIFLLSLSTFLSVISCYPVRRPFIVSPYLKRAHNNNIGQNNFVEKDFERYLCIFPKKIILKIFSSIHKIIQNLNILTVMPMA
jgi:hypothetical protein